MCVPVVFCVPPPPVEQGYVVAVLKTEYEVGYDIHYLCKKHFLLDGPQKVTCLSNGKWSAPPPHCRGESGGSETEQGYPRICYQCLIKY